MRHQEKCIQRNFSDPSKCKSGNCSSVTCHTETNNKSLNSNADVIQSLSQTQRAVNAVKYGRGGSIVYGNNNITYNNSPFLGNVVLPLRNRF